MHVINDDIKVILFDHDDTLVGTIGPKWDEHKFIAKKYYGKDLTDSEIKEHWGKPLPELVCLLYGTDDADKAIAYNKKHHASYPKRLFPHTVPVLRWLRKNQKLVGVVTATIRFSFEYDLASNNILPEEFDFTQTAEDTSYHKPDPRVFKPVTAWLAKQGIQPNHVLYIGDGLHDMAAAYGAGFQFLGVETGLVTGGQFREAGAASVPTLASLLPDQKKF